MTNTRQFFSTQIFAFSAPKWRSARLRFSASSLQICHCLRALFSLKVDPHRMWHTLRRPLEKWTKNFKNAAPAFARGKKRWSHFWEYFKLFIYTVSNVVELYAVSCLGRDSVIPFLRIWILFYYILIMNLYGSVGQNCFRVLYVFLFVIKNFFKLQLH